MIARVLGWLGFKLIRWSFHFERPSESWWLFGDGALEIDTADDSATFGEQYQESQ